MAGTGWRKQGVAQSLETTPVTRLILLLSAIALLPYFALAKRSAPPRAEPVIHDGTCYVAPNDDGRRAYPLKAANTLYILEWQRQVWLQQENQEQPGRQLNA
jgi:hypothetical protein